MDLIFFILQFMFDKNIVLKKDCLLILASKIQVKGVYHVLSNSVTEASRTTAVALLRKSRKNIGTMDLKFMQGNFEAGNSNLREELKHWVFNIDITSFGMAIVVEDD